MFNNGLLVRTAVDRQINGVRSPHENTVFGATHALHSVDISCLLVTDSEPISDFAVHFAVSPCVLQHAFKLLCSPPGHPHSDQLRVLLVTDRYPPDQTLSGVGM